MESKSHSMVSANTSPSGPLISKGKPPSLTTNRALITSPISSSTHRKNPFTACLSSPHSALHNTEVKPRHQNWLGQNLAIQPRNPQTRSQPDRSTFTKPLYLQAHFQKPCLKPDHPRS